jgi:hypothetical protein
MKHSLPFFILFWFSNNGLGQSVPEKAESGFIIPARENYLSDKADLFSETQEIDIIKIADSIYNARKIRYQFLTVPAEYLLGDSLLFDKYSSEVEKIWPAANDEFRILFISCKDLKISNLKFGGNFNIVGRSDVQQAISRNLHLQDAGKFTKADENVMMSFSSDLNKTIKVAGFTELKITGKYYESIIAFMRLSSDGKLLF